MFSSSTDSIPSFTEVPRHVAIIMDGNGRWAKQRFLPRIAGHKRGVDAVRETVRVCTEWGVQYLTLFAFSTENWRRPPEEVSFLMGMFLRALDRETEQLANNNIRLKIIGNRERLAGEIVDRILTAERRTADNTGLTLTIAADYGGRWDIVQSVRAIIEKNEMVTEQSILSNLSMSFAPEPDLFIRTGGEQRISNFLLWQLAYTELYFTDILWPDFNKSVFYEAIFSYRQRERRFGRTSEQLPLFQQREK